MTCIKSCPKPSIPTHPYLFLLIFLFLLPTSQTSKAPFIQLDTIHQAYSQFQINLILNQNRNHPILLTTVSINQSKNAAISILEAVHRNQPLSGFSVLVQCGNFQWNLNHTLGICQNYYNNHVKDNKDSNKNNNPKNKKSQQSQQPSTDQHFSCSIFIPSQLRIQQKGHTIIKNHNQQSIPDGKHFTQQYLSQVIKKNIPDFVHYIEDQYQLTQFLQENSDFKISKQPKLLYFDQNLLAPMFLRKLSALMDGKIQVAVTDDPPLAKKYTAQFDSLIFLQYSFDKKKYQYRDIPFDQYSSPQKSIINDITISKYLKVKKNRDILLDFQFNNYTVYQFNTLAQLEYLQTHGRAIVIQISKDKQQERYQCVDIYGIARKYGTLFNYVCYNRSMVRDLDKDKDSNKDRYQKQLYFVVNSVTNGTWLNTSVNYLQYLPRNSSRQKISTQSQAQLCLRAAKASQRDPIFFYFNQKSKSDNILIMNYLNSLPQVTSLLYICQIILPDDQLIKKFSLKQNTLFTLKQQNIQGQLTKLQHTKIQTFIQIKMFLREISIQKMLRVYEDRLINNQIQKIDTSQQLTDKCFDRKCIIALIATGRYREQEEIKIIKELKLQYEELFRFVWIDGICHWDVPRQLKMLKKKQKVIDRSYVFYYNEKDITYSLWESKKFWDKKQLEKWLKSLRNTRTINHLKFAIDIEDRVCKKKSQAPMLPDEL